MKISRHSKREKLGLNLASAIDIVFLLLIFFLYTFRITANEGDIQLKLPQRGCQFEPENAFLRPTVVAIRAQPDRSIQEIEINGRSLGTDLQRLTEQLVRFRGVPAPEKNRLLHRQLDEGQQIDFYFDERLNYEEAIRVVTAAVGKRRTDGETEKYFREIVLRKLSRR